MQTIIQNISNSFGYIKCGEILKSEQSYQDPYILRCIQCHEIYLLLESFILHFEDECKMAISTKNRIHRAKTFKEDNTEDVIHEVQNPPVKLESDNHMQLEDPLIVVKNEVDDESLVFEEGSKLHESESRELFENAESHKYGMVSEYHTQYEDEGTTVNTQDENESEDTDSGEDQKPTDVYFKETLESSKKAKHKNLQICLYPESENLQGHSQLGMLQGDSRIKNEQHMQNDIFSMLSGSGFHMNLQSQPEVRQKQPYMENVSCYGRYSEPDVTKTLQSGARYHMGYYSELADRQGQSHVVCDQLYGKSFKDDVMIGIGNDTFCRKKVLDMTLGSSHKSTHIARKLLEGVFKMETLLSCTLTGIAPRAQGRERMSQEVVQLDFKARSAIVDFAVRIGQQRGWAPQNVKLIERAMSQRIGEIKRIKHQCIKKASTSNSASSAFVSSFMKSQKNVTALIAAYKDQPQVWNKNMPFYGNKLKRREFMEQIAQDLNKKHKLNLTGSQVSAVVVHLCRKYQEDLQKVQEKDENEDKTKKQYYVTPWFLEQLEFIKPYLENYSLEILNSNLANLLPQQIVQILEMYRSFSNLWNSNLIEHHCKNKRQETLIEMLKSLEVNMNLKITDKILEDYIRTIHNYFTKEKRKILNNKKDKGCITETSANEYYEHLTFLYDHVRPFRCSICGGEYINPLHFKMHKSNHDGTVPFTCSQCNKTFKRVNVYISHAKRHLEDLNHVCKECGKKFITFTNLRLHMRIHTGDKPYCCEMCGESFRFLQTLSNHRRRHEKRYLHSCKICSQGFYSKLRHDDHMNSHLNIRSYICDVCSKAFITKRALQQHKVVHEDIRKHACKLCGKTFKHRAGVNQHMKTHDIASDDKSYAQ